MDKFKVGQRVRFTGKTSTKVKISEDEIPHIGECGNITSPSYIDIEGIKRYKAKFDVLGECIPVEDCIEPVYDGDEKSSWEECVWKPLNVSFPA